MRKQKQKTWRAWRLARLEKNVFKVKDNNKNVKSKEEAVNFNLDENDIDTESEQNDNSVNENIDEHVDKPNIINGELMVGSVTNIDDIENNISTLSLNDKVKDIINLFTGYRLCRRLLKHSIHSRID